MSLSAYRFTRVQPHTIRGGMAAYMRDIPTPARAAIEAATRQRVADVMAEAHWIHEQARGIRASVAMPDGTRVTYYRKHVAVSFRY